MSVKIALFTRSLRFERALSIGVICLVLGASLFFRTFALDRIPGINGDEVVVPVTIHEAHAGLPVILRMPTGRMFSPVYAAFSFLIDQTLPRNFLAIRLPSLIAGILLVALTFFFTRKVFGSRVALLAVLLVAVSPTNIAYSRSGVEQSFTGLFGVLLAFTASRAVWWGVAVTGALALLMHPTNIFYLPLVIFIAAYQFRSKPRALAFAVLCGGVITFLLLSTLPSHFLPIFAPTQILRRISDLSAMLTFVKHWFSLISGVAAIEQFVGPLPSSFQIVFNSVVAVLFLAVTVFGIQALYVQKRVQELVFVSGAYTITLVYYLISGNFGIEPGVLRYALVMLNPTLIALAVLVSAIGFKKQWIQNLGVGILFLFLGVTAYFLFNRIQVSNSVAHATYKTGALEPKFVAFQRILSNARGPMTQVLVEDWWTFWPLRYLALSHPGIRIQLYEAGSSPEIIARILDGGGLVVSPAGGFFENWIKRWDVKGRTLTSVVEGYGGQKVLHLWAKR